MPVNCHCYSAVRCVVGSHRNAANSKAWEPRRRTPSTNPLCIQYQLPVASAWMMSDDLLMTSLNRFIGLTCIATTIHRLIVSSILSCLSCFVCWNSPSVFGGKNRELILLLFSSSVEREVNEIQFVRLQGFCSSNHLHIRLLCSNCIENPHAQSVIHATNPR